jgi:ADP-ribose pyrophosphatase YjhB (NUDIX family)
MIVLVQVNMYRFNKDSGETEYLLVQPIKNLMGPSEDKYWQPLTREVRGDEAVLDAFKREVKEGTGIHEFAHLQEDIYSYEWFWGDKRGRSIVFFAGVNAAEEIQINEKKDRRFDWFPYAEARQQLHWTGEKEALEKLDRIISTENPFRHQPSPDDSQDSDSSDNPQEAPAEDNRVQPPIADKNTTEDKQPQDESVSKAQDNTPKEQPEDDGHPKFSKFGNLAPPKPHLPDISEVEDTPPAGSTPLQNWDRVVTPDPNAQNPAQNNQDDDDSRPQIHGVHAN